MERVQEKESTFFKKLMTPIGFGTAIAVSAGIGLGLAFLSKKLGNSKSEYQKLIEKIKTKLEEGNGGSIYSESLTQMVYKCVILTAQKDFNELLHAVLDGQKEVIDDPEKYCQMMATYGQTLIKFEEKSYCKVIKDAGGLPYSFVQHQKQMREDSEIYRAMYIDMISRLRANYSKQFEKKELNVELLKKIFEYKLNLCEDLEAKRIKHEFPMPILVPSWIHGKILVEFDLRASKDDFVEALDRLAGTNPELNELVKKTDEVMDVLFKRYMK